MTARLPKVEQQQIALCILGRDRLRELTDRFELDVRDRRVIDHHVDALVRGVDFADVLAQLYRDELKAICEALGLDTGGRAKQGIIDRILDRILGNASPPAPTREKVAPESSPPPDAPAQRKQLVEAPAAAPRVKPAASSERQLDVSALGDWLWKAACKIRGPVDAPRFKDYILPLIFLKRLSDVFDDEVGHLAEEFGDRGIAARLVEQDHKLVRFYIPGDARWSRIATVATGLGQALTDAVRAVARQNPRLSGVIDVTDFNATTAGQRIVDDERLAALVQVLNDRRYRLGLEDVEPDILGRAYEYLLRKFAEGQGQRAGEFYTPPEVAVLMARMLDPQLGMTVYDPCCGSGGLLVKCHLRLLETKGTRRSGRLRLPLSAAPLKLFGQEINASTFAMSRMNAFIHDMETEIALGDSMHRPAFTVGGGSMQRFDLVAANPLWNQKISVKTYGTDTYGRFDRGTPPSASADWGWIQHMLAALGPNGRMAVVLDTGAVSRGSGNQGSNKERDVRRKFVDDDLVEAVLLLPENLFFNTSAPGIVLIVNPWKRHPEEILLINASKLFAKGRPKNFLEDEHLDRIAGVYHDWQAEDGLSAVVSKAEAVRNDYNLSPSRYVSTGSEEEVLPLDEAVELLAEAEEERLEADRALDEVLTHLGFAEWRSG